MGNKITKFMSYDLYWSLIKNGSNKAAGRFAKRICTAMFTDNELPDITDKEEAFVWSNIEDILKRSKGIEQSGKIAKTLNKQMRHFTFLEAYYRAIDLMNEEQSGVYIKALCICLRIPNRLNAFRLWTNILLLQNLNCRFLKCVAMPRNWRAKVRKKKLTFETVSEDNSENKQTDEVTEREIKPLTFEEFMKLHPTIKDDVYPNSRGILKSVDWTVLHEIIMQDSGLSQNRSLFWLLQDEKTKSAILNG